MLFNFQEMLKDIFHYDLEENCGKILKENLDVLRKQLYLDWEKIQRQLKDDDNMLYSMKKVKIFI